MIGGRERFRTAIVAGEVAMALVLLTGTGLLLKSFLRLHSVPLEFESGRSVAMTIDLPESRYRQAAQMRSFCSRLLERCKSLPGVKSAAIVNFVPLGGTLIRSDFTVENRSFPAGFTAPKWR